MSKKITDLTALTTADITDVVPIVDVSTSTTKKTTVEGLRQAGEVVQVVMTNYSAAATGTTTIPFDDTIPQNTEGTEFMTQAITPKSATNLLIIEVVAYLSGSNAATSLTGAIFQDSTANALATGQTYMATATGRILLPVGHSMTAGTASSTTFKFRAGPDLSGGGTVTFNGANGTRYYGATTKSYIKITEVKA